MTARPNRTPTPTASRWGAAEDARWAVRPASVDTGMSSSTAKIVSPAAGAGWRRCPEAAWPRRCRNSRAALKRRRRRRATAAVDRRRVGSDAEVGPAAEVKEVHWDLGDWPRLLCVGCRTKRLVAELKVNKIGSQKSVICCRYGDRRRFSGLITLGRKLNVTVIRF
jgi:hypothetical protein